MTRLMIAAIIVAAAPSTCVLQKDGTAASTAALTSPDGAHAPDGGVSCGAGTTQAGSQCVPNDPAEDPLIGSWTGARQTCDFFPNHVWNQGCTDFDGWAAGWDRIGEDRYVLRSSNRNCWARTSFSGDGRSVRIDLDCASNSFSAGTNTRWLSQVDLTRRDLF